jgi:hypothetical protein
MGQFVQVRAMASRSPRELANDPSAGFQPRNELAIEGDVREAVIRERGAVLGPPLDWILEWRS